MNAENFSNICNGIFRIVAILAIIVAGGWGLFEYYDAKKMQRIENSREYIERLTAGKVTKAEQFLVNFWSRYEWESGPNNDEERAQEIIQIVEKTDGYETHLKNILNFLEQIALCVEQNRCEKSVVITSFGSMFSSGVVNHHPWIVRQRKVTGHTMYHARLECFVRRNIKEFESEIKCNELYDIVG